MNPIYSVIIGTELLNGRRTDKHFPFLVDALKSQGHTLSGNLLIADNPAQMIRIFNYIKDENAFMFCFGGIGATPDDYTRAIAAKVFTNEALFPHPKAISLIRTQFGEQATTQRLRMAELPKGATLLQNPINNVPGFVLKNRYFFMPGFPQMAHPMALEALKLFIPPNINRPKNWLAFVDAPESIMIPLMETLPKEVSLSSLPHLDKNKKPCVEIELSSTNIEKLNQAVHFFKEGLNKLSIVYKSKEI